MATYYISTSGNNGNAGTLASPWRNLSYACSTAITAGDIIHVIAGTYNEATQSSLRVGVSIEGEGITSIIRSQVGGTSYTIRAESGAQNTNGNQHISNIKMDGSSQIAYGAILVNYRGNVEIYNCTFVDFNYNGVWYNNGEPPTTWATGNKFHHNTVTNCGGYIGINRDNLHINGQDGMLIYNNTITQNRANGLNGNCIGAVEGFNKNVKIYNNTLNKTCIAGTTPWDFALEFWNCLGGIEIYDNIITGSIDLVLTSKGTSSYSVWIHDNIIGQPTLLAKQSVRGVLLEYECSDVIIERNYIHDVAAGVYAQQGHSHSDLISNIHIRYNIFNNIGSLLNATGWGVYWSQEGGGDITNNLNIWNNVFIAANNAYTTSFGIGVPSSGTATNISIRNNIIQGFDSSPIYGNGNEGGVVDVLSIENNIFYQNGNSNAPLYVNGFVPTNNTTQNNLIVDPLFVSASDFHLQAGSDGIDGGLDVGLLYDYEDYPVTDPPNIGAYEAGSSPVVSPPPVTPPIPVTSVTVVGAGGRTIINIDNGTLQMYAHVLPANADDLTVTWSVINGTGTASISATGLLTAITNGTVTVKATSNG